MRHSALLCGVLLYFGTEPRAVAQSRCLDLNTTYATAVTTGTGGGNFTRVGNEVAYFGAIDGSSTELFFSDGTTIGTRPVHSFLRHRDDSGLVTTFAIGNRLLFVKHREDTGFELWVSDGTDAGTRLLRDFLPGPASGLDFPTRFVEFQGLAWFGARDPVLGFELWRTDGTEAGTQLAVDIWQGPGGSAPTELALAGGQLFLLAGDGAYGRELWVSDGTQAGSHMVADLSIYSDITNLMPLGNGVVFSTTDRLLGNELFFSDGTAAGTVLLADLVPGPGGSNPRLVQRFGTEVVFLAETIPYSWTAWRTNGTPAGTVPMLPQWTFAPYSISPIVSGSLLFAWLTSGTGWELWRTDGTTQGTTHVLTTPPTSLDPPSLPVGGGLFTAFDDGVHGREPWFVPAQGVAARIADIRPGSESAVLGGFVVLGDEVWFPADDGANGVEPWVYSATTGVLRMVADYSLNLTSSNSRPICAIGQDLVFTARTGANTAGLFRTDGTPQGTVPLYLSTTGAYWPWASLLAAEQDQAWFTFNDGVHGVELWRTDGTASGTTMVKDIEPGSGENTILAAIPWNSGLLFSRYTSTGSELWRTDGSEAGTVLLIAPFGFGSPVRVGQHVLFAGSSATSPNTRLWRTDGTAAGTTLVSSAMNVRTLVPFGSEVLVFTYNPDALWRSDGTGAGTQLVLANAPPPGSAPVRCRDFAVYMANDGTHGYEPWRTDGTAAGTYMLADIHPGGGSSQDTLFGLTATADGVFFTARSPTLGTELWVTDGTIAGTQLVRDILPGPMSSLANHRFAKSWNAGPIADNHRLVFLAEDLARGEEFWVSDGTAAGTYSLPEVTPGSPSTYTWGFVRASDRLYWQGFDPVAGYELWCMPLATVGIAASTPFGRPCGLGSHVPRVLAVDVPRLANPAFAIDMVDGPPNSLAVLLWSVHRVDSQFGSCTVHPSLPAGTLSYLTDGAGTARANVPIPNDPGFLGLNLFLQWLALEPSGPLLYLAVASDALHVVIGG